jgi:iron complex outermembrane receptor protein
MKGIIRLAATVVIIGLGMCRGAWGGEPGQQEMTAEGLLFLEVPVVVTAAKREQSLSEVPAAMFVLTQEDIRRSGLTSIPELLRLVPGVEVARINANMWAITARGFNARFANKLLVLIDGRVVYDPEFAGVFWDMQDTLLEDIERIEVIRGPGGTLWGANAVNGVITIISKRAEATQGTLLSARAGSEGRYSGSVRRGGRLGETGHWRVYAKYFDRDEGEGAAGSEAADDWRQWRTGFRLDGKGGKRDDLTLEGDLHGGQSGARVSLSTLTSPFRETFTTDDEVAGGNLLGRWKRTLSASSEMALQLYYDRAERERLTEDFRRDRDTFDLDFQHRLSPGERQEIVWGMGYRFNRDDFGNTFNVSFHPDSRETHLFSAFAQDEIALVPQRWFFTLGSKLEHNDFTGFEIQPSARLRWTPSRRHTLWTAVSRAVRTPSRSQADIRINFLVLPPFGPPPATKQVFSILGDRDVDAEESWAFELGWRTRPTAALSLDVAAFYNDYDNLSTLDSAPPFTETLGGETVKVVPLTFCNDLKGETYGVEVSADWQATEKWRWSAAYSFLRLQLHGDSKQARDEAKETEGSSPRNQFQLRSQLNLPHNLEFDVALYYVDNLSAQDVPSYLRLDTRLGWRPVKDVEVSLALLDLLDDHHPEFGPSEGTASTEVERSFFGKVTWRF